MTITSEPTRLDRVGRRVDAARATSRSSTRRSTATAGLPRLGVDEPEAGGRHRRASPTTTASTTPTSTAGSTRSARRRPRRTRRPRVRVARFINAPDSHELIFTRNATEAINLVAYAWGRRNIGRGDAIVLTEMEHHANLVPWQLLVQEQDGDLEFIPITDDGLLRLDVFEVLLRLKPKLVAFTHVSNTLGTINPVARDGRDGARGRRARARRRRPGRAARAGRRPGAGLPTSTRSAATRCSARWARARCGRGASCSRRCRRSSPAAR